MQVTDAGERGMASSSSITAESVAVVTGASRGIGREVALGLARTGVRVVMVARDTPRLSQSAAHVSATASGAPVVALPADLSRMAEVRRLAAEISQRFPRIKVLLHGAAAILRERRQTQEGFEATFATNVMAPFLLTHLLLERLRAGAPSRVIFFYGGGRASFRLDDLMSARRYRGWTAYNQSKNADVMLMLELAQQLRRTGIAVNAVLPGIVNTEIIQGLPAPLRLVLKLMRPLLRTPSEGASAAIWAATAPELAGVSGKLFGSLAGNPRREFELPRAVRDPVRRQRLDAYLGEVTGITHRTA
jgi:NAD(P)-dependent dehydrogenase (short-subunit alcohol dehydrogenase family)